MGGGVSHYLAPVNPSEPPQSLLPALLSVLRVRLEPLRHPLLALDQEWFAASGSGHTENQLKSVRGVGRVSVYGQVKRPIQCRLTGISPSSGRGPRARWCKPAQQGPRLKVGSDIRNTLIQGIWAAFIFKIRSPLLNKHYVLLVSRKCLKKLATHEPCRLVCLGQLLSCRFLN